MKEKERNFIIKMRRVSEWERKKSAARARGKKQARRERTNNPSEEVEYGVTGDREKWEGSEGVEGEHCAVVQPRQTPRHHMTVAIMSSLHHQL